MALWMYPDILSNALLSITAVMKLVKSLCGIEAAAPCDEHVGRVGLLHVGNHSSVAERASGPVRADGLLGLCGYTLGGVAAILAGMNKSQVS